MGRSVSIGLGSVICGDDVEVGDNVRIGFLTVIRGSRIRIGSHVQIGSLSMLEAPELEIGEGSKINEQVFVGGLMFPDSRLTIGRNCQIMQMTFINPTRSIVIGDDSGIGGDCLLFGHSSWLSNFEGYPVEFDSIEIGRSVSIAWRVFVLPGTRIGDGAVIGANSLVRGTIPAHCLAVGFPARVVSKTPEFPREMTEADRVTILRGSSTTWPVFSTATVTTCGAGISRSRSWPTARAPSGQGEPWRFEVAYEPRRPETNPASAEPWMPS